MAPQDIPDQDVASALREPARMDAGGNPLAELLPPGSS
jgi:hypothetical protein